MTREEAALENCRSFAQARNLKAAQIEREIRESDATDVQKANMLHTLSKLGIFASDERDQIARLATSKPYQRWLDGQASATAE